MVSKASPVSKAVANTSPVEVKVEDGTVETGAANVIATPKEVSKDNHGNQIEEN